MGYWKNITVERAETKDQQEQLHQWLEDRLCGATAGHQTWAIDAAVVWLQEIATFQAARGGVYPPLVERVEEHVVLLEHTQDDHSTLRVYDGGEAVEWYLRMLACDEPTESMEATRPEVCPCEDHFRSAS